MAKIAIDFGSSNSGACINLNNDNYNADKLKNIHCDALDSVAKQPTEFWIKRNLMSKNIDEIVSQMRVLSCVQPETLDFNIVWSRIMIEKEINNIVDSKEWIGFRRFKMHLYEENNQVKASDGSAYDLEKVIAVFLRIIVSDCMAAIRRSDFEYSEDDIEWGVTVPAIWDEGQVNIMRRIIDNSISGQSLLLREPECALIGIALNNKKEIDWEEGRITLVVDAGGGTTDLAYMIEEKDYDNCWHFRHLNTVKGKAAGGNEIDNAFWQLFSNQLVEMSDVDIPIPSQALWNQYGDDNPAGKMVVEDIWMGLKHKYLSNGRYYGRFDPASEYKQWLSESGYSQIVTAINDNFGVPISAELIKERCFEPVIKKIEVAVKDILDNENTPSKLRLAYAGGLSSYKPLRDRVTKIVKDKLGADNVEVMLNDAANTNDGAMQGAIIFGGAYILTKGRDLIQRIARKTYLTDFVVKFDENDSEVAFWNSMKFRIALRYHEMGIDLGRAIKTTSESFDKYRSYKRLNPSSIGPVCSYLEPLCLEGKAAYNKYTLPFLPLYKDQTKVVVDIYSTHELVVPFPMEEGTILHHECKMEYDFGYTWEKGYVEIDFNEAGEGLVVFRILDKNRNQVDEKKVTGGVQRGL